MMNSVWIGIRFFFFWFFSIYLDNNVIIFLESDVLNVIMLVLLKVWGNFSSLYI